MDPTQIALYAQVLPGAIAGVVLALAMLTRSKGSVPALGWSMALAFGVSQVVMLGWSWPPKEGLHWLPWIGVAGAVVATIESSTRAVVWPIALRALVCAAAAGGILRLPMAHWPALEVVATLAALGAIGAAGWTVQDALARREKSSASAFTLGLVTGAIGGQLLLAGNAKGIQLAAALGAGVGVWWLFSLRFESLRSTRGGVGVPTLVHLALLIVGAFLGDLSRIDAAFIVAAPATGWAAHLRWFRSRRWARRLVRFGLPVACAGIGVLLGIEFSDSSGY